MAEYSGAGGKGNGSSGRGLRNDCEGFEYAAYACSGICGVYSNGITALISAGAYSAASARGVSRQSSAAASAWSGPEIRLTAQTIWRRRNPQAPFKSLRVKKVIPTRQIQIYRSVFEVVLQEKLSQIC